MKKIINAGFGLCVAIVAFEATKIIQVEIDTSHPSRTVWAIEVGLTLAAGIVGYYLAKKIDRQMSEVQEYTDKVDPDRKFDRFKPSKRRP